MAAAGVTVTGLKELEDSIRTLPDAVQKALRLTALVSAERIKNRARELAPYDPRHKGSRPHVRDTIKIKADLPNKQYVVSAGGSDAAMLAVWLEYGTEKMTARPFMRPAGDAESDHYTGAMAAAAEDTAAKVLG